MFTVSAAAATVTYCALTFWQRKVTLGSSVAIRRDLLWTVCSAFSLRVGILEYKMSEKPRIVAPTVGKHWGNCCCVLLCIIVWGFVWTVVGVVLVIFYLICLLIRHCILRLLSDSGSWWHVELLVNFDVSDTRASPTGSMWHTAVKTLHVTNGNKFSLNSVCRQT